MNLIKSAVLLFLIIACAASQSRAQEIYHLNLDESLALGKEQSYRMKILKQNLKKYEYELRAATSKFKTHVDLDLTLPRYTETIMQYEDSTGISFYPLKQSQYNSTLSINQPLPTDGYFYIRSGFSSILDHNQTNRTMYLNTRVGLIQPFESFYAYNNIKASFKKAKLNYELSLKQLKREELDLVYFISRYYYNLLESQERRKIARLTFNRQKEAYEIARNKYNAGLIREVEALQMEVDLSSAQNDYDMANADYDSQLNIFKENLAIDLKDSVSLKQELNYQKVIVDTDKAVDMAVKNRMELDQREIMIQLSELEIKRRRSEGIVSGSLSSYYDFIGVNKSDINSDFGSALGNTWDQLQNRPGNFTVAVNVNIPIIDWGENKARVKAAKADLQQNLYELEQDKVAIEREVLNLTTSLQSSLRRLELLEKSVKVAEKSFAISSSRFTNGEIDSQALALDRERLNNAYLSHLKSYIEYKLHLSDLKRKTYYDFENNREIF